MFQFENICLDLSVGVGVPVGRFSLVAGTDVRTICPGPGIMVYPGPGVILVVSNFSNSKDNSVGVGGAIEGLVWMFDLSGGGRAALLVLSLVRKRFLSGSDLALLAFVVESVRCRKRFACQEALGNCRGHYACQKASGMSC